jgi:glutamine cyclotransferase
MALAAGVVFERQQPLPSAPQSSPSTLQSPQAQQVQVAAPSAISARKLSWRVLGSVAHDRSAFLQGLLWDDGGFYESTGLEGRSSLRRLAADGRVLKKVALPPDVFGEGLTLWRDTLIQISWQDGRAWKWDKRTLSPRGEWRYNGEGWGITSDGSQLIMSDGSDSLFFRDPGTFRVRRSVRVTLNGRPLRNLNELEYINGRVWANVWQTDQIVLIDPRTGVVTAYLDLANILPPSQRAGGEDVLNGIAYDARTRRIWVSGKLWPRIFSIQVESQN